MSRQGRLGCVVALAFCAGIAGWSGAALEARREQAGPAQTAPQGRGGVTGGIPPAQGRGRQGFPQAPYVRTGIIVGRVIDADTGKPVPGAAVTLNGGPPQPQAAPIRDSSGRMMVTPPPLPTRYLTDNEGRFAFRDLTRGSYTISANKPGYADGATGRMRPNGPAQPIQLADNQRVGDVTIRLFKLASISGTITDTTGEPVVGVQVRAYRRTLIAGRRILSTNGPITNTDDRGLYRFGGLTPGAYVVAVLTFTQTAPADFRPQGPLPNLNSTMQSPGTNGYGISSGGIRVSMTDRFVLQNSGGRGGGAPTPEADGRLMTYPSLYYPASRTAADAQPIRVASGDEKTSADMTLPLVPTGAIFGRLLSPTGDPPSNWALHLVPADSGDLSADPDTGIAITNAMGEFMFLGIPEGQYVIQTVRRPQNIPPPPPPPPPPPSVSTGINVQPVTVSSFTSFTVTPVGGVVNGGQPSTEPVLWTVMPVAMSSDYQEVTLALREGLKLSGRVEFQGSAERPPAQRLAQMAVTVEAADGRSRTPSVIGRLDANGDFTVTGLLPGKYLVRAPSPGGWTLKSSMVSGVDAADVPVDIGERDIAGVVITFTDQNAIVRGTVRSTDTPVPDSTNPSTASQLPSPGTVILFPTDSRLWTNYGQNPRRLRTARASGGTGSFIIGTLPAGEYYAVAIPEEYATEWQDPAYLEMLSRVATRVVVNDSAPQNVELRTEGVKPPGGGDRPAPEPDASTSDVTHSHGPAVDEQVSAPAQGPVRAPQVPQTPAPSVTQPARDPGAAPTVGLGSIAGRVVIDEGGSLRPARRARVSLRFTEQATNMERAVLTDDEGKFAFTSLPPGRFSLSAGKPSFITGYYMATRPGRPPTAPIPPLAAGQQLANVILKLTPGGVITGVVRDDFGQPVSNVSVRIMEFRTIQGERRALATNSMSSDDRGVYRFFGLMPGTYYVSVTPQMSVGAMGELRQVSSDEMNAMWSAVAQSAGARPIAATTADPRALVINPEVPLAPPPPGVSVSYAPIFYPDSPRSDSARPIPLGAGQQMTGIDLSLRYVRASRIDGTVTNADGTPATEINVQIQTLNQESFTSNFGIRTLPEGKFEALSVAPGRYRVIARARLPPPPPGAAAAAAAGGPVQYFIPTPVFGAEDIDVNGQDVSVALRLGEGLTMTGRLVFSGSLPKPQTSQIRINASANSPTPVSPTAKIEEDGSFVLKGFIPGLYSLFGSISPPPNPAGTPATPAAPAATLSPNAPVPPSWRLVSAMVGGRDALDFPLEISPGQNITGAVLTYSDKTTDLVGSIVDANGKPVTDLIIVVFTADHTYWPTFRRRRSMTRPRDDGSFRLFGLPPGEYYLAVVTSYEQEDIEDPTFFDQLAAAALKVRLIEGQQVTQNIRIGG